MVCFLILCELYFIETFESSVPKGCSNVFFPYPSIENYSNIFISVWPAGIMITLVKCDLCRAPFLNSYFS